MNKEKEIKGHVTVEFTKAPNGSYKAIVAHAESSTLDLILGGLCLLEKANDRLRADDETIVSTLAVVIGDAIKQIEYREKKKGGNHGKK